MQPSNALPPASADLTAPLRLALLTDREATLTGLYRQAFPRVRRHVGRHGGTEADAQDVFHDALVIFYEKAVAGTLPLTAPAASYLLGISRNLWRRERARRGRLPYAELSEDELTALPAEPEAPVLPDIPVLDYVERLGERCKSILLSFYYFRQPLEQIAQTHHYATVRSATVQKFKCLERLRDAVKAVLTHLEA